MKEVVSLTKPMVTVITPSYNRAGMIPYAIESVLQQDFESFEHIVIDGGSTDGTLEVLKRYPHLKVISGSDQGMYDALNKGLELATGEIVGFLNTDDLYAERVFSRIAGKFADPSVMAVAGHAIVFLGLPQEETKVVDRYSPVERSLMECSTIGSNFFNAWFFRRSTFSQIGGFDGNYKIIGDRDFMFRFALNDLKYTIIDDLVYKYGMHEASLTFDKNGEKRAWSADEHLAMTESYLADARVSNPVRKLLIELRTRETVDMAARGIWMLDRKKAIYYLREGSRYNPAWPFRFFQYILKRGLALLWEKRTRFIPQ